MARILVLASDEALAAVLREVLPDAGHTVDVARTGVDGARALGRYRYDTVVLDDAAPDLHTPGLHRQARGGAPLLALLGPGLTSTDDVVIGGADAYLSKPVSWLVLVSRIHALTRRARPLVARPRPPWTPVTRPGSA